jgi:uncharacterized membrane protein YtjA (UPF0391 family)
MTETTLSKIAKIVFIIALIVFLFKDNSLFAVVRIRELILDNLLLVVALIIITLIWLIKMKGGKNG